MKYSTYNNSRLAVCCILMSGLACGEVEDESNASDAAPPEVDAQRELTRLANFPSGCDATSRTVPDPSKSGHLAAVSLRPETYPFTVTEIEHWTASDTNGYCTLGLPHELHVFVADGPQPVPAPSLEASFQVLAIPAQDSTTGQYRTELSEPITLEDGQYLIVGFKMDVMDNGTNCIRACSEPRNDRYTDWWSDSAVEPYPWASLFGKYGNFRHSAMWAWGYSD